jgi:hypothetical protein
MLLKSSPNKMEKYLSQATMTLEKTKQNKS